jgi:hypothetical protein
MIKRFQQTFEICICNTEKVYEYDHIIKIDILAILYCDIVLMIFIIFVCLNIWKSTDFFAFKVEAMQ